MEPNVSYAMGRMYNEMMYDTVSKSRQYFDTVNQLFRSYGNQWSPVERHDILFSLLGALNQVVVQHKEMSDAFNEGHLAHLVGDHVEKMKTPRIKVPKPGEKKRKKPEASKKPKDPTKKKEKKPKEKKVKISEPQPSK